MTSITITVPDDKKQEVQQILKGIQSLIGKDFKMAAETLKEEPKQSRRDAIKRHIQTTMATGKVQKLNLNQ